MTSLAAERRSGALPAEVTSFIGRRDELIEVRQALAKSRLVTLCGTGGVGKSRLALRVAAEQRRHHPDGMWVVELSALREPELLPRTVADALGLPDHATGDVLDLLAEHLAGRRPLLVLDTCEHLVDACAMLTEVLLRASPDLRIIATSREPLDVMGEYTVVVRPLPVPAPGDTTAAGCDSMALFADRAAAVVPGFVLNAQNRPLAARLCRRLDGIPLALELAAVRLRVMSIEQIVERLDDRFRLLGTTRTSQYRHQTLRAAVEWSHDLCTPAEQLLWARLSIFPGDFDLEAAERICGDSDLPVEELLEVLSRLVEKSVLHYEPDGRRYRMLGTLREFGAELLHLSGQRDALRRQHHDHFAALAAEGADRQLSAEQLDWSIRFRAENDNLRIALEWALSTPGEEQSALRLVVLLRHYWHTAGRFSEGRDWYRRVLEATEGSGAERGWAIYGAGLFAVQQGDLDAADPLLAEALAIGEKCGDAGLRSHALQEQARVLFASGDLDGALAGYRSAQSGYRTAGHRDPMALTIYTDLAAVHALRGETARAAAICEEGMLLCEATGEEWSRSFSLWMRGAAHWLGGDTARAVPDARESLRIKEAFDDLMGVAMALDVLMVCAATDGQHDRAAVLAGAAERMWEALHTPALRGPHYAALRAAGVETARAALGADRMEAALRRGRAMPFAAAVAFGRDDAEAAPAAAEPQRSALTRRELEIAALVAEGLTNRQIADRLVIAKRTVDAHVEHILAKLEVPSRTQVAVWYERRTED